MKKGMIKKINKGILSLLIIPMLIGLLTTGIEAATFTLSKSKSSVAPGGKFTVTIKVNGAGRFDVSAKNATVSPSSVWCENSCSVNVTASQSEGTATVTVKAVDAYTWDEEEVTGSKSVNVTIKKSSGGSGGSNTDKTPSVKLDTAAIKVQIEKAKKLDKKIYTAESWNALESALKTAEASLTSNSQDNVNKACEELKKAIANLVLMDYTRLQDAISQAEALIDKEDVEKWRDLVAAMVKNKELLKSNDQLAVEKAADEIYDIIDELMALLALTENDVIIKDGDIFCNVGLHKVWPILFFISLAGNAVLIYMLVSKNKRRFNDNIPVVDYDINDDDK